MKLSLRSWIWRVPLDQEVDEELELHLELRTRELVARGMEPAAARALALERMGDVARVRRTCVDIGRKRDRQMRILQWIEELRTDVTFALRQLRSAPVFALVAVVTLALGIGGNSAIFALVDATLLRPLPYADPSRLVAIHETIGTNSQDAVSPPNLADWNARSRSFERIAGYTPNIAGMVMAGADGRAETVSRQWVTAEIFDVLGVKAIAGRTFLRADDEQRKRVMVLSESFWRTRFNGDPAVIGRDLRLDGSLWTVVGVVPEGFQLIGRSDLWGMRRILDLPPQARGAHVLGAIGRLKLGVSREAGAADLAAVAAALAREYPQTNAGRGVRVEGLHEALIGGDLRQTSLLFLGVVGFVLLICCGNVANLLLARATVRTRELAIRGALGAGRRRIVRQLLTESLVLSLAGGLLGLGVGAAILRAAPALVPEGLLPAAVTLTFDLRLVAFCASAAIVVGLLFGIAPAWQATSIAPTAASPDERTTTGSGGKLRALLVMGEVATAVLLLFCAGLLLRSLIAVGSFDRGYRAGSVVSMVVDPLANKYPTAPALQQFYDEVEAEARATPGVADMAWTTSRPLDIFEAGTYSYEVVGDPPPTEAERPGTEYQAVSHTYFSTLQLPIVAGRAFDARDKADGVPVCIVNEAFAKRLGGGSPIGRRLVLRETPAAKPVVREIVGVARQVKGRPDETTAFVQVYAPLAQDLWDDVFMVARPASGEAEALVPSLRAAVARIDKEQLVSIRDIRTLDDIDWAATGRHRFRAAMVGAFAALALALAMVGVFGILAYAVQQQVRDVGVRRALGASTSDILRLVVSDVVRVVAAGAAIGIVLAAISGHLIATMLFGVQPLDVPTFVLVAIVLAITAALAIAGPAWRAAKIDPAVALRSR
jgi:putative ABC transport system permease protein